MENTEKAKVVSEPVSQIKQMIEGRLSDYNTIITNIQNENAAMIKRITDRLDTIESGSIEFIEKKKFISKINRYLSIVLYENTDVKVKPEKARLKDLEKLNNYFSLIENILIKVENKIDDKLANKIADKLAEAEYKPARYIDINND